MEGLVDGGLGEDLAPDGEGGDGLKHGEGRAPLAGRGEVVDADLVAGEGESLVLGGVNLSLSEEVSAMEDL